MVLHCLGSNVLANKDCIRTLHDFQQSLVNRSVNLDSLQIAFSPPNHQASISFVVHYRFCSRELTTNSTANILCSELEDWINDVNAGRKSVEELNDKYEVHHKFSWNASPINLFIRPKLLKELSLYTFQIGERHTHIVLDQFCESLSTNENVTHELEVEKQSSDDDACKNPPSHLMLLEQVTVNVSKCIYYVSLL